MVVLFLQSFIFSYPVFSPYWGFWWFFFSDNNKVVEILLAHEEEPILRSAENKLQCFFSNSQITSVVPGDFDGDALMDVMVTTTFKRTGNL